MDPKPTPGVPEDWTHHHVIFSNPGTFGDAAKDGTVEAWNKIALDQRYQVQQLKRDILRRRFAGTPDYAGRLAILKEWEDALEDRARRPNAGEQQLKTDWSMDLGTGAKVGAGQYPAMFSFDPITASCSDWIAYNTGIAGVSGAQANIAAYTNLYETTCGTTVPSIAWAYYTGTGSALTSSVLSLDGAKVAYVENTGTGAILRILAWYPGQGTPAAAHAPDKQYTNTSAGAGGNTAWNTTTCPATGSCLISVAFQNGAQDTISSPFYVYEGADILYVGDATGHLHKFTGIFNGTPGEVTTGGWPITVSANKLTSPVYDSGTSGNIFVADSGGFLYSYKASTAAHVMTSSKLTFATGTVGIADSPMLDSTTEQVYVFAGDDANTGTTGTYNCHNAGGCGGVFQFAAGNTTSGTGACRATSATAWAGTNCGHEALLGTGGTTVPTMYDGSFDHIYEVGTGTTGHLWACTPNTATGVPRLSAVNIQASGGIVPTGDSASTTDVTTAISALTSAAASCSPVTEIWGGASTTNDYIYLSVSASGTLTTTDAAARCLGACLYNFVVATGGTATTAGTETVPTTAYAGIAATLGSSGIIIDNTATAASESQIYYTPLGNQACAGNGSTGNGTGGCAIQTSQAVP